MKIMAAMHGVKLDDNHKKEDDVEILDHNETNKNAAMVLGGLF